MASPRPRSNTACATAVAIGVVTVVFVTVAGSLLGRQTADDWHLILIQFIVVTAPFGFLALAGVRKIAPWTAGLVLTGTVWGYYLYDVSLDRGVNFLLAPLILLSPIGITIVCFAVNEGWDRRT